MPSVDNAFPVEAVVTKFTLLKKEILFFTNFNMEGLWFQIQIENERENKTCC